MLATIAFGGGCHWCTEAVFQQLKGVQNVQQGYVSSFGTHNFFSEGVIVSYKVSEIPLWVLIHIHLLTHKSTSNHSRRRVYRSAIYIYSEVQKQKVETILGQLQKKIDKTIITQVLPYKDFKASRAEIQDYYSKNPNKPFCKKYIDPKLALLQKEFGNFVKK